MNIEWLKNKLGEKFYPITHAGSVLCGDSNETLEAKLVALDENVDLVQTQITTNLVKPILGTVTQHGVTFTNNGDGTYTLNGTASDIINIIVGTGETEIGTTYKLIGCPQGGTIDVNVGYKLYTYQNDSYYVDDGNGREISSILEKLSIVIQVNTGVECDNITFKPMLTTNLNATYDDFVPFTGTTGKLNGDVAEIGSRVEDIEKDIDEKVGQNGCGEIAGGKNLLNSVTMENGYINEYGNLITHLYNIASDFIPFNNTITVSGNRTFANIAYCLFDENKQLLIRKDNADSSSVTIENENKNAKYIRVWYSVDANTELHKETFASLYHPQIEFGNIDTDYEPYYPSNKMLAENKADKSEVATNLLNITIGNLTQTGITIEVDDGKIHAYGTSTENTFITIGKAYLRKGITYKIASQEFWGGNVYIRSDTTYQNSIFTKATDDCYEWVTLNVWNGQTVDLYLTPIITTNLNATYDDFVPFTGNTGKLNGDVAELEKSNEGKMGKENPTGTGAFSMNRKADTTVGDYSTTEGSNCEASAICSHAEGERTTASGSRSHAEGNATTASGNYSHSEGSGAKASGESSHAEGIGTVSSNTASHAEGYGTTASSPHSHAEGFQTFAKNTASHAEGYCTEAYGKYSHTGGNKTVAWYQSQTAIGEYNENKEGNLFEVGNGTSDTDRSNALELNKYGDLRIEGDFIDGYGNKLSETYAKHTLVDYYDESTLTKNCFLLGGNTISNTYWSISDYIPCCNGDIVYGASNNSSNNLPVISLYDKDKNWIKDVLYSGINYFQWKVEIDDVNAKYFRANIASTWFGTSNENQYLIVERGNRDSEIIVTVDKNKSIDTLNATTFVKGLSIAYNLGNCKLLVEAGVYDIISELGQLLISTEDGGGFSEENWGLLIGNNVRVIGNGNVKLTANYTGSSKNVTDYFSILNSTGSFELNEINMECQNVRYCLHEDIAGITTEPPSTSAKVINCNMKHKGTVSTTYSAPCCIGAGTSYNESVSIEGGYYSSPSSYPYPISYHNGFNSGNTAILRLSNVKFADGNTLRLFGFVENGSFVDVYLNNFSLDIHYEGAVDRFNVYN